MYRCSLERNLLNKVQSTPAKNLNVGNPISVSEDSNGIIATMNLLNGITPKKRTVGQYVSNSKNIDLDKIISSLNKIISKKNMVSDTPIINVFSSINTFLLSSVGSVFTAFGVYNKENNYINIRFLDKNNSPYTSKVFLNDNNNPLTKCYTQKSIVFEENHVFLNNSRLPSVPCITLPLFSFGEFVGAFIVGDYNCKKNKNIYQLIANYISVYIKVNELNEKVSAGLNIDTLTQLQNHRGFQETLAKEISAAKEKSNKISVMIFDVDNITKINRELGHAKGDEIVKVVADKIKTNISTRDTAGRYGGDEIGVILPNTSSKEAKYMAEYLTYTLSCCMIDGVGPIKVSVGIATYPEISQNQENLLIMAEQAMYMAQSQGYKDGKSSIVSCEDFNFWDKNAINSFAEVLAKRHAKMGMNFEDELIKKFNTEEIKSQSHLMEMVTSLAGAIDAKDPYTKGHSTSVSRYSEALAKALDLPEVEVKKIALGALLHDVGKIGIPEDVLKKPTNLTNEEWEIMKQHPTIGAEKVLMPNDVLRELVPIVKYHHERWDGKGYPEGLKGEDIPLAARIVSIADSYHALVSDRPYRKGMSVEKACEILKMGAGIQWDSELIRVFIQIAPSISTII